MLVIARTADAPPNYYVDSARPNDSGGGLTPTTAFKNPSAVPWANNLKVAFKYGSGWYASCDVSAYSGIWPVPYGNPSDGMPFFDGTVVVTGWVAGSSPNTWVKTGFTHDGTGTNRLTGYENDVLMSRVADDPTCSSTANSFVDIKGSDGSPLTLEIHTSDGSDPNTNGKAYRFTARSIGFQAGNNCKGGGIRTQRVISNNGSFQVALNANVNRILAVYGTKHNAFIGSGVITDAIACRSDPPTAYEVSNTFFVGFNTDAAGLRLAAHRCFCIGDNGATNAVDTALIMHDSAGHNYAQFSGGMLASVNTNFGWSPTALLSVVNGYFVKNSLGPIGAAVDDATWNFGQNQEGNGGTGISTNVLTSNSIWRFNDWTHYDTGSFNGLFRLFSSFNTGTLAIARFVFCHSVTARPSITAEGMSSGAVSINNSIFVYPIGLFGPQVAIPTGVTYTGDYNVFLCPSDSLNQLGLKYHGTTYNTLAAWQAATGQDAHSIALGPSDLASLFSGTTANGDFRLGLTGAGARATLLLAGPANHLSWSGRVILPGPPTAWPVVPATLTDGETYVRNPSAWAF